MRGVLAALEQGAMPTTTTSPLPLNSVPNEHNKAFQRS